MRVLSFPLALSLLILTGCNSVKEIPSTAQACPEARPMVCTLDYQPVCGFDKTGSFETYSNHCSACADQKVIAVVEGECQPRSD